MRKTVLLYPAVRLTALLLSVCFLLTSVFPCITYAGNSDNGPAITSPAAILMEASTGQVIYHIPALRSSRIAADSARSPPWGTVK